MIDRRRALALLVGALSAPRAARAAEDIRLMDLYAEGEGPSERGEALEGNLVRVKGFMAPPLRAQTRFFVLTTSPMPICPFCDEEADWSDQILAIYAKRVVEPAPFWKQIAVTGALRFGPLRDPDTGFVSMARLENADWRVI